MLPPIAFHLFFQIEQMIFKLLKSKIMKFIITIFLLFIVSSIMAQQPPCGNNPQAGNTCQTAVSICDLDGYCGNTSSSTYSVNSWSSSCGFLGLSNCGLTGEFCGSI